MKKMLLGLVIALACSVETADAGPLRAAGKFVVKSAARGGAIAAKGLCLVGKGLTKVV